jgi:hypothetical protein
MIVILYLALAGGLFSILSFIHFFVDWVFQSHAEAMVKHNNAKIRAKHCAIYTIGFLPILFFCWSVEALSIIQMLVCLAILFTSHFFEDTYLPVYLWAKYIRRPPQMTEPIKEATADGYFRVLPPDPKKGFLSFVDTALGKILMIAIDQIIHLAFLFPIVWFILHNVHIDANLVSSALSCKYPSH